MFGIYADDRCSHGPKGASANRGQGVTLVEKWEDAKALEDHFKTPHMVQYMEDVKNLIVGRKVYILQPA
jgi:quinol monooxygenase YgiN